MLDLNDLVKRTDFYVEQLNKRGQDYSYLYDLAKTIKKRNKLIFDNDNSRSHRNNLSKQVSELVQKNYKEKSLQIDLEINKLKSEIKTLKQKIDLNEKNIKDYSAKILETCLNTPNLPHEKCPLGKSSKSNVEIRRWGTVDNSKNTPHWDISVEKNIIEYKITSENNGSRFVTYLNEGAKLKRALMNFMLDTHNENGYTEINLPILTKQENMYGTGQFPKFMDDAYICKGGMVLIPTSEVSVTNFHKNQVINSEQLPISYCSFSECFRKEAGAAGKDTRGIIRLHQFSKVELVKIVEPQNSESELDKIVNDAEMILQKLNLPYRVLELCSGDLGFSASKTYDIEVWMPSRQDYVEISSCSNFSEFQSRRMKIKSKNKDLKSNVFVHTLNGSGLAIDRLIASVIENNYSVKDKKISIPSQLQKYFNKKEI